MTSRFTEVVVHCHEPERLAAFWCEVLDFEVIDRGDDLVEIGSWVPTVEAVRDRQMSPTIIFIRVDEPKSGQNRLHLDVSPIDRSTEDEVLRLLRLGALRTDVGQGDGRSWEVLADPEGNEFCVLRTLASSD